MERRAQTAAEIRIKKPAFYVLAILVGVSFLANAWFLKERPILKKEKNELASEIAMKPIPSRRAEPPMTGSLPSSALKETAAEFGWDWFKTDDLRLYRDQLRAVDCPFQTTCDIVLGEINRRYGQRLSNLRYGSRSFWKTGEPKRLSGAEAQSAKSRTEELRKIAEERDALARELLGIDYKSYASREGNQSAVWDETLAFMPDSPAKESAHGILQRYRDMEREIVEEAGGTLGKEEMKRRESLYAERANELKSILAPAEVEEIELRDSLLAETMRNQILVGFEPSEQEFRAIYRVLNQGQEGFHSPENLANVNERQIEEVLGSERFADYKRSQDAGFRTLMSVTDYYEIPRDVAVEVYKISGAGEAAQNRLLTAGDVSELQRNVAMQQVREETAQKLHSLLGQKAFQAYMDSAGRWLRGGGQ